MLGVNHRYRSRFLQRHVEFFPIGSDGEPRRYAPGLRISWLREHRGRNRSPKLQVRQRVGEYLIATDHANPKSFPVRRYDAAVDVIGSEFGIIGMQVRGLVGKLDSVHFFVSGKINDGEAPPLIQLYEDAASRAIAALFESMVSTLRSKSISHAGFLVSTSRTSANFPSEEPATMYLSSGVA